MGMRCKCTKGRNCGHRHIGVLWAALDGGSNVLMCLYVCTYTYWQNLARAVLLSIERSRIPASVNFHEECVSRGYDRMLGFLIICLTGAGCCAYRVLSRYSAPVLL